MMTASTRKSRFTLIELLVVMVIIVVLAGTLMAVVSVVQKGIRVRKTKAMIKALELAFEQYKDSWGYYPQSADSLMISRLMIDGDPAPDGDAGIEDAETGRNYITTNDMTLGYRENHLADAFNRPFFYQSPGTMNSMKYDLWSVGPDGAHAGNTSGSANVFDVSGDPADAQKEAATNTDDIANWKRLD